jgi:outer membrane protein assembly factor BamE
VFSLRPIVRSLSRHSWLPAVVAMAVSAAGCSTVESYLPQVRNFGVYKLDINQGNYLSQDMVDKLRVGQTKPQVRQLLGTPLIVSAFRDNRWDYVYEFTHQGQVLAHRNFAVYFVDDKLARWEGDEMPASQAELNREALARTADESRWGEERSWWDSIVDIFNK